MSQHEPISTRIARWIAEHLPRMVVKHALLRAWEYAADGVTDASGLTVWDAVVIWDEKTEGSYKGEVMDGE